MSTEHFRTKPWRVGRKLGRTIYVADGEDDTGCASLLGMMETEDIARYVVDLHNRTLGMVTPDV